MEERKRGIAGLISSPELPLLLMGIALIVAHCFFPTDTADDAWFANILEGDRADFEHWSRFLRERYYGWSSRVGIEGLLILATRFPILWRVGDTLICMAIVAWFSRITNPERDVVKNTVLCGCVFIFPLAILWEAGFVATTLNYTWPLAAALVALTPAVKQYLNRQVSRAEYVLAIPMLVWACFQELLCATVLLVFLASAGYRIWGEKKVPVYQGIGIAVCAAMLIFALTCPGNDARTELETAAWLPEFANLSAVSKVELGFSSMIKVLFLSPNVFTLIFCAVIGAAVWLQCRRLLPRILSLIPAVFILLFGFAPLVIKPMGVLRDAVGALGTGFSLTVPSSWLIVLLFAMILACLMIALRYAVSDLRTYLFWFIMLLIGAASRIALGLSPTVWASGERTCAFLYLVMTALIGYLVCRMWKLLKPRILR